MKMIGKPWSFLYAVIGILALFWNFRSYGSDRQKTNNRMLTGDRLKSVGFPIGGIGAGNLVLGGRGNIENLEIFNRPAKDKTPELTFFSIWIGSPNRKPLARILERRIFPPYTGWMGYSRNQLAGLPRFEEAEFRGDYPFARVRFKDPQVPVDIELEAYNPLIPLSPEKSGVPGACFRWTITNPSKQSVDGSIALSMQNPIQHRDSQMNLKFGKNASLFHDDGVLQGIRFSSEKTNPSDCEWGEIVFATPEKDVDVQTRWYRGEWWDNAHRFWDDFSMDGRLENITEPSVSEENQTDVASLLVRFSLAPGESRILVFTLTWFFPNRKNDWNREEGIKNRPFRNHYATQFSDAWQAARFLTDNQDELLRKTRTFVNLLSGSSYPDPVIDAMSSQLSTLKTQVLIWDDQSHCYGWEGLTDNSGCCMGTCTHVWNYEQTLAYLFPSLERSMREIAFLNDTFDNGYQTFRTLFPPCECWWNVHPAADGQLGNIVRVFREWKISGDTGWLKTLWPKVKASLEFAWKGVPQGSDAPEWQKSSSAVPWDPDHDGIMEGRQHNTYDIDFYGPNPMVGSIYLAALKAASLMATALGEDQKAEEYIRLYDSGKSRFDTLLWNGNYYVQRITVLEGLTIPDVLKSPDSPNLPKYQYGDGCLADQLLGQFIAHASGLGFILDRAHVEQAMGSIFRSNFMKDLSNFSNVQRVYALNHEAGLLLCSWPKGNRPALPFVYSDEVWTGIEYQVAASLIWSGLVEEGLTVVEAARARYDGRVRNPWDELECGHHYARALSSWALLLALSGFSYDGVNHTMGFDPKCSLESFSTFWSTGEGWGGFRQEGNTFSLSVDYGSVVLADLAIPEHKKFSSLKSIFVENRPMTAHLVRTDGRSRIVFDTPVTIRAGETMSALFTR